MRLAAASSSWPMKPRVVWVILDGPSAPAGKRACPGILAVALRHGAALVDFERRQQYLDDFCRIYGGAAVSRNKATREPQSIWSMF
jgi:hypothetical protein